MQLKKPLYWILVATCLAISPLHAAEDQHDDHEDHQEAEQQAPETKGPHGGVLLKQDDATVELQIFEQGVPPEYRAWVTKDGTPITEDVDLNVQLTRLGGQEDTFDFAFQGDYWLGNGVVTEPHSFDVEVTLALNGKQYQWQWESHEGRTRIAADIAEKAGIRTAEAGPGSIERTLTTYGQLTTAGLYFSSPICPPCGRSFRYFRASAPRWRSARKFYCKPRDLISRLTLAICCLPQTMRPIPWPE